MLYPDFSELMKLQAASMFCNLNTHYKRTSLVHGDYTSFFKGHGMEFEAVRPYVIGDDVRYVDWRVTARTCKPHIKTFQAECDQKILLVIDANPHMYFGTRGTFKSIQAARAAAILSGIAFRNRDRVGGLIFGTCKSEFQFFPPARQRSMVCQLLKILSKQPKKNIYLSKSSINSSLRYLYQNLPIGALIFLISDIDAFVSADPLYFAKIRKKAKLVLLPVIDPIDEHLPNAGALTCLGEGNEKLYITMHSKTFRQHYQTLWHEQCNKFIKLVKKYRLNLIFLRTDEPVQRALNLGLKRLKKHW